MGLLEYRSWTTLAKALENVDLETGRIYRCEVKGQVVELRVLDAESPSKDKSSAIHEDDIKIDAWIEFPALKPVAITKSKLIPLPLPDPPIIPEEA